MNYTAEDENSLCACGHRKSEHRHGSCNGQKTMARYVDQGTAKTEKTRMMSDKLALCECTKFVPKDQGSP
jgi:hypothetical protein